MNILLALTETDKRVLIALGLLLILIFVIVGYLGLLVEKIMKRQAKKASEMMHDVIAAKIITNERDFKKFGRKKNNRLLIKQTIIPITILFFSGVIYLIYAAITKNWGLKIFDHQKEGFGTILFLWDFANAPKTKFFGMDIICDWPPILNTPHFEAAAWASYIIVPCLFVGGIWFLVATQAHIARTFRLKKLAKQIFNPTLDNVAAISPLNQTPTQNQNNIDNNNNINNQL